MGMSWLLFRFSVALLQGFRHAEQAPLRHLAGPYADSGPSLIYIYRIFIYSIHIYIIIILYYNISYYIYISYIIDTYSKCYQCQAGPCSRWCSSSNWCGDESTHGGSGATDCTRYGTFSHFFNFMY